MTTFTRSLLSDFSTLWRLTATRVQGDSHAERLESFYARQAAGYDSFRRRLLHGRDRLMEAIIPPADGVWIDFGAGTGENAQRFGARLDRLQQAYLVDLCPSLLAVAHDRIASQNWSNVTAVAGDATCWQPPEPGVDLITFSYSLTMIPGWFDAIDHAHSLLKPGGIIGVTDFYVSRKHPSKNTQRHHWLTRHGWPTWFAGDNVFLSPDHLPYLQSRFEAVTLQESAGSIPYLPLVRVPYYVFVGRKREGVHRKDAETRRFIKLFR